MMDDYIFLLINFDKTLFNLYILKLNKKLILFTFL